MTSAKVTPFPWSSWKDATRSRWADQIVEWFEANYERKPQPEMARQTMAQLLNCVFGIIQNSRKGSLYLHEVTELGKRLSSSPVLDSAVSLKHPHHHRIMRLLEHNLQSSHPHMFMVPQVSKSTLLERPDYSALLLSVKLHADAEYKDARRIALGIGEGCSLAQYIIGQSERRLGIYDQAHIHLDEGLRLLTQRKCACPFDEDAEAICDEHLLRAVILRAKAVVFRKQKNFERAEEFYAKAEEVAEKAMEAVSSGTVRSSKSAPPDKTKDTIWVEHGDEVVYRVVANVHFSHGYYWYQKRDYDQAQRLFKKAIDALEKADEDWDSPYTRLAIVKLCRGNYQEAADMFAKARDKCEKTLKTNREASLSLALCILGRKVIELTYGTPVVIHNPMEELEKAIDQGPKALGPWECHRDDAKHFLEVKLSESARELVNRFVDRLEIEIRKIKPLLPEEEIDRVDEPSPEQYVDFDLSIAPNGHATASSIEGQASADISVRVPNTVTLTLSLIDRRQTNTDLLKQLGQEFYNWLFPGPIHAHFRQTEAVARVHEAKIRLRLRIEADPIASLPLEFIYRTEGGYFMAINPDTALSRYLNLPLPPGRVRHREGPLHLLTIIANPSDQTPLNPDEWEAIIQQALAKPIAQGQITLQTVKRATSKEIRNTLLRQSPDIIQFVGHGIYRNGKGYLALVNKDSTTKLLDDEGFANLFLGYTSRLGLISLATCESAKSDSPQGFLGIAPKLVQCGIPAVVAMQYTVFITTAKIFLENFYAAVAARKPVDWATQWARNAISQEVGLDNREFATPVLYMRAADGQVF